MSWMSRFSLNQKLALLAFALGAIALFAAPYQGSTVTIDTKALAVDITTGADQVVPRELASWILAGRADYRLIDIRSDAEFAAGQIPTAEHIPAALLLDAGLERGEAIVVYGDDGVQTAQAWLLLRAKGYRGARLLKGGLVAWNDQVVSPVLTENPTPEQRAENDKLTAIAAYFGGQPRTAAGATPAAVVTSAPPPPAAGVAASKVVPAAPAAAPKAPARKKESC
jgi:rhodanese-related sulfurtransferase